MPSIFQPENEASTGPNSPQDYSVDAFAEYPFFIDTGTALVDKANVDDYARAAQEHAQ